jgi:hypothetical protein
MTEIRRRFTGAYTLQVESRPAPDGIWRPVSHLVALGYESPYTPGWEVRHAIGYGGRPRLPVLPFQPLSVRHFYGSEQAILEAAYAHLKRIVPPIATAWETFLAGARDRLPALAVPSRNGDVQTAYRFNNPLSVVPSATPLSVPAGARGLDFEPRLGFVIARELADATPEEAAAAIAAFVLMCEFTAGDGIDSRSGTVTVSTTPPSSIAEVAVSARALAGSWQQLTGSVSVNGKLVAASSAAGSEVDVGELLAAASADQRLVAGELFSIDALAPATPAPALKPGDHLVLDVPRLGRIEHAIS